jgi:hypothetical protein
MGYNLVSMRSAHEYLGIHFRLHSMNGFGEVVDCRCLVYAVYCIYEWITESRTNSSPAKSSIPDFPGLLKAPNQAMHIAIGNKRRDEEKAGWTFIYLERGVMIFDAK